MTQEQAITPQPAILPFLPSLVATPGSPTDDDPPDQGHSSESTDKDGGDSGTLETENVAQGDAPNDDDPPDQGHEIPR